MSQKPPTIIPYRPATRPASTGAPLPLPKRPDLRLVTERARTLDLKGKRKAWFFIGRGRIGKTTLARWCIEAMDERGGSALIAAADPTNRSLRTFIDDVAEPPSSDSNDVRDWLRGLLQHAMENDLNAMIDFGGGSTSLIDLLHEIPDLADVLSHGGIEPVAVHVIGPDIHDIVPLAAIEGEGFRPKATVLVLNERHGRREKFEEVLQHPAFRDVVARGAQVIWMPLLTPDFAQLCDSRAWHYREVHKVAGPFITSAVHNWLRRMADAFEPITTWFPE
jgi:hypothetical protein